VIAFTRPGFTWALLCLRPIRTLVLACAEDPPLIAKILEHVQEREAVNNPPGAAWLNARTPLLTRVPRRVVSGLQQAIQGNFRYSKHKRTPLDVNLGGV
jgi:hypothetical protein